MNKTVFALVVAIVGTTLGAQADIPFEYTGTGVEITKYTIDSNDIEIILDIEVTESIGTLELELERSFFDSRYQNQDDKFTIIADGDLVPYSEILKTRDYRVISFNLVQGTEQVEIFGSHLNGKTAVIPAKSIIEPEVIFKEDTSKIDELNKQILNLKQENQALIEENKELDSRIFELENLVDALEIQVTNLNGVVSEQVKVIYNWVLGSSFS